MSYRIDRVFYNAVENSSRRHPHTPRKFLPFSPPTSQEFPLTIQGGTGVWIFSGITQLKQTFLTDSDTDLFMYLIQ